MENIQDSSERTRLLISSQGIETLKNARVAVVGVGGVGGMCAQALARSGVGTLILIDKDTVEPSNLNRQVVANVDTIGQVKVDALKTMLEHIQPGIQVICRHAFYDASMNEDLLLLHPDYVIDCIDSIGSKKDLIRFCIAHDIPFLVSTGTARKKDGSRLKICEVEETSYDPIARAIRQFKRKEKIRQNIMVVFSDEKPVQMQAGQPLPSMIFVPGMAGLLLAQTCVMDLLKHSHS